MKKRIGLLCLVLALMLAATAFAWPEQDDGLNWGISREKVREVLGSRLLEENSSAIDGYYAMAFEGAAFGQELETVLILGGSGLEATLSNLKNSSLESFRAMKEALNAEIPAGNKLYLRQLNQFMLTVMGTELLDEATLSIVEANEESFMGMFEDMVGVWRAEDGTYLWLVYDEDTPNVTFCIVSPQFLGEEPVQAAASNGTADGKAANDTASSAEDDLMKMLVMSGAIDQTEEKAFSLLGVTWGDPYTAVEQKVNCDYTYEAHGISYTKAMDYEGYDVQMMFTYDEDGCLSGIAIDYTVNGSCEDLYEELCGWITRTYGVSEYTVYDMSQVMEAINNKMLLEFDSTGIELNDARCYDIGGAMLLLTMQNDRFVQSFYFAK